MPPTCKLCGKEIRYVRTISGHIWVHADTGRFISDEPIRHDANTYAPTGGHDDYRPEQAR